jgi:spore coat polysaccharide biosynthesis predicted glycosyltransferase SpsG
MRRLPVATVVDRGLAYVPAALVIDGSIEPHPNPGVFAGPMYAVLDPSIAAARDASAADRAGVLIALGGGSHVHEWGTEIASAIHARMPDVPVRIAGGFARAPQAGSGPVRWIAAPQGLAGELRRAAVAVVAGGMTLYEGAALAVPLVGLAVVAPQQAAIAGFARRGAAIDAGLATDPAAAARTAAEVVALLRHRQRAEKLAATAARLVDGRGAFRAADAIRRLARRPEDEIDAA